MKVWLSRCFDCEDPQAEMYYMHVTEPKNFGEVPERLDGAYTRPIWYGPNYNLALPLGGDYLRRSEFKILPKGNELVEFNVNSAGVDYIETYEPEGKKK